MTLTNDHLEAQWARIGVLFNCAPADKTPDLERLLLNTARGLGGNARLLPLVVTWLITNGNYVAKHRLRRLAAGLEPRDQAALGLIVDAAVEQGAPADLRIVSNACRKLQAPQPLFDIHRTVPGLESLAQQTASALSRRWGLWTPPVELKPDAIRPVNWLLAQNPSYHSRIVRKGDLRSSILEALRQDANGKAKSEAAVAQLSGATRAAVRNALAALIQEGEIAISKQPGNRRDNTVTLCTAA
jgi:hypothetical protein